MALSVHAGVDFPFLWYLAAVGRPPAAGPALPARRVKCRWLIGDAIAFAQLARQKKLAAALKVLRPSRRCYHDDFELGDPVPLVFEGADYLAKMIRRGGSFNPVTQGQIR